MNHKAAALIFGVAGVVAVACRHNAVIYDGFEAPGLGRHWETKKFLPGAVQIQSSVVRAGKRAAGITLRPGDKIPQEKGSELERAELLESRRLWSAEDSAYEYSFSAFVPQDFPIVPTRLVIAQWKQHCPVDECTPDSPVIAIRFVGGELSITHRSGSEEQILYRTRDDIRNRWLDFRFQIRFGRSRSGRIKVWLDDTLIADSTGPTAYPASGGYPGRNMFYFKMGLYRDQSRVPMTLYFDEYRKQKMSAIAP